MNIFTQEHTLIQEKYKTKQQAQHWVNLLKREVIEDDACRYLESLQYFFFATSNKEGHTNVNFKGIRSGKLIKVLDERHLIFPDYKGNGIFHGLGDIMSNPNVALLCIDFSKNIRVKISGTAQVIDDTNLVAKYSDMLNTNDAQRIIKVTVGYLIPNCSQQLSVVKNSILNTF
ncbi:MAG: pyridoxamine 5'-phosphate oxidase family protein [Campylobacterales bacterium]|nr:pyridoxamine 5'-phosphate oxidase family protein [Campylobacterales bacterium]